MSVPKGWTEASLGDVLQFRNGINFQRTSTGSSIKILGVGDFGKRELIKDYGSLKTVQVAASLAPDDLLENNDVVFVRSNGSRDLVGRCVLIGNLNEPVSFSGFTIRGRLLVDDADPVFISKLVQSDLFAQHLLTFGGGSSISNLSQKILIDFHFFLPPLPEQSKIAEILRTWDDAEDVLMRFIATARDRRHWLRQEVLSGQRRLPGFSDPWIRAPLSSVLDEHGNRSTGAEEVHSVSVHKGVINQMDHLGRSFAAKNTADYNRVSPGDIVYTKSPTGDFPLGVIKQSTVDSDAIVSPLYGVFKPSSYGLGSILNAYFESPQATQNYLRPLVQKGAKNTLAITNRRFLEGQLPLPSDIAEQEAVAEVLNASTAEIKVLETELNLIKEQKRGLMQQLLMGKIRVKVDEGEAANV